MKNLIIGLFLTGTAVQAQTYYESSRLEEAKYSYDTGEYDFRDARWEDTRFIVHREWFAIEVEPGRFIKTAWALSHKSEDLGDCYILEGDTDLFCLDHEDNKVFLFLDFIASKEKFEWGVVLSKIEKIKPFKVDWE